MGWASMKRGQGFSIYEERTGVGLYATCNSSIINLLSIGIDQQFAQSSSNILPLGRKHATLKACRTVWYISAMLWQLLYTSL